MKTKTVTIFLLGILVLLAIAPAAFADGNGPKAGFGELYYDGDVVRTVVPPAAMTRPGVDNLYVVPGQRPVAAVAPGDPDYHGGKWAFHSVTWNVEPYSLTSEEAILEAAANGDVTITRVPENDFKCPIQP